jgi:hypothetical protein
MTATRSSCAQIDSTPVAITKAKLDDDMRCAC